MLFQYFFRPYLISRDCYGMSFQFHIDDLFAKEWYDITNEKPEIQFLLQFIREDDVIIDCGAHHGFLTVLFAQRAKKGQVLAIEAIEHNSSIIVKNVCENKLTNVTVAPLAISSNRAIKHFSVYHRNIIYNSNGVPSTDMKNRVIEVASCTLGDITRSIKPSVLKVDVEGAEIEALRGGKSILKLNPLLDIEIHCFTFKDRLQSVNELLSLIDNPCYSYFIQLEVDGEILPTNLTEQLTIKIAQNDNPHLFAIPTERLNQLVM